MINHAIQHFPVEVFWEILEYLVYDPVAVMRLQCAVPLARRALLTCTDTLWVECFSPVWHFHLSHEMKKGSASVRQTLRPASPRIDLERRLRFLSWMDREVEKLDVVRCACCNVSVTDIMVEHVHPDAWTAHGSPLVPHAWAVVLEAGTAVRRHGKVSLFHTRGQHSPMFPKRRRVRRHRDEEWEPFSSQWRADSTRIDHADSDAEEACRKAGMVPFGRRGDLVCGRCLTVSHKLTTIAEVGVTGRA